MDTIAEGTLNLSDGRRPGYAEWGPPDAPPVIYCHGFPTNHKELEVMPPVLERNSARARLSPREGSISNASSCV